MLSVDENDTRRLLILLHGGRRIAHGVCPDCVRRLLDKQRQANHCCQSHINHRERIARAAHKSA